MIPVSLKMRNFMCYRENVPALDFGGIHLACLSGDNGNGKSAIIDAITWALWGKARAGSIDDLIHSLASEMEVEFDFTVGADLYRVIRKRTRPKKRTGAGQSSLEFQIGTGDSFRPLTGNVIDETQQKIIDTLHMDYDTFVNSAYLRQGHADEFTRQPAGKRKDVLGTILDLGVYDALEDKARALARQYDDQKKQLESGIAEMAEEIARRPEYETAFTQAQETLAGIETVTREKEQRLTGLRSRKEALETRQSQLDELTAQSAENTRLLRSWEEQFEQYNGSIRKHEQVIARKAEIEAGFTGYTAARKTGEELSAKFQQSVSLERQKSPLQT
ncbi:MAG: SMC family ATPase, partial [Dehalococcoidales bacterium]|nr:SMC family ATPase [Dehalococcoidales bacterium]